MDRRCGCRLCALGVPIAGRRGAISRRSSPQGPCDPVANQRRRSWTGDSARRRPGAKGRLIMFDDFTPPMRKFVAPESTDKPATTTRSVIPKYWERKRQASPLAPTRSAASTAQSPEALAAQIIAAGKRRRGELEDDRDLPP